MRVPRGCCSRVARDRQDHRGPAPAAPAAGGGRAARRFTTAELRTGGRREGFLVEAVSGAREVLAHVDLPGPPRVGRYGVDLAALDRVALPALCTPRTGGVVVVDELGKMELASVAFRDGVMQLLDRDVAVVATVHQACHQFTDALRRPPDIRVVRVTETTRDALPERLMDRLIGAPRGEEQ